jgi:hypothetical protein
MVDSVAVLPPGWRAFDNNGNLLTDAILAFFDAGTSDARTVYSDANLSVSLGTTVNCNSAGYPVSSGNAKTLIYTGSTAYKIRLTSVLFGGTVFEHDNVRGALDTSTFLTSAAVADRNIVNVSADRAVTIADKGSLLNVNCSAAAITLTFDDASDCEGLWVGIRHDGTANQVKITGDGTDTFGLPGVNATAFALAGRGQTVWISCEGASFKVESDAPPLIMGNTGVIAIADRLATPPGSPNPGARYIVTSSPTGDWSSFAQHDIAEANGFGGWFRYTPASDCGWIAYVQDEDVNYQFRGSAWGAMPSGFQSIQTFTASGTWTKPSGIQRILVIATGGGAGGRDPGSNANGGGGGAGATCFKFIDVSAIASETVTIGAGGAINTAGGNTTFGAHCTAGGGATAAGQQGGIGGTGTSGNLNVRGGHGGTASIATSNAAGGHGGASFWGDGGPAGDESSFPGLAAVVFGAGGPGRAFDQAGAAGMSGVVVVLEFGS